MYGVGRERQHVDGAPLQRPLLVQPGEQQHVLDQPAHPGGFLLHALHDPVQVHPGKRPGPVLGLGIQAVPRRRHGARLGCCRVSLGCCRRRLGCCRPTSAAVAPESLPVGRRPAAPGISPAPPRCR